ncbi:MAG: 30S ribosome-binding factor RbfA [Bacteroidales bacterium]|nr:30S ribosome-binding factor RbfA [Bacteroidales bacterium]
MDSLRQNKVSRLIQKDLGEIFQKEGMMFSASALITVTKVYVSRDLSVAKVYLSLFTTGKKETLLETIRLNSKDIRFRLGQRIKHQLRVVPDLQFFMDDSLDYIEKIEKLLGNDEQHQK